MVESNDTVREGVSADTTLSTQNSMKSDELQNSPNRGFSITHVTSMQQTLGI